MMSLMCLAEDCVKCKWHVIKGDKLDCNFENRLGLGKRELGDYIETEEEEKKEEKK